MLNKKHWLITEFVGQQHLQQTVALVSDLSCIQVFGTFPGTKTEVLGRQAAEDWV